MDLHDQMRELEDARSNLHSLVHAPQHPFRAGPRTENELLRCTIDGQLAAQHATADDIERAAGRVAELAARISGGEYRPAYNGHKNRETWNASLWLDNDQPTYHDARAVIVEAMAGSDYDTRGTYTREQDRRYQINYAADKLRDWYEERFAPTDTSGPLADAWTYAVAVADWPAIVENAIEGMEPDPTEHPGGSRR